MDFNDPRFLNSFPPPGLTVRPQEFPNVEGSQSQSQSQSQTEALQGIQQNGGSLISHPTYPLSVSIPDLETITQPATPPQLSACEGQSMYRQPLHNQTQPVSTDCPPSAPPAPPNYFTRQLNSYFGNYVTAADIEQQSRANGQQHQFQTPQTVYQYVGPIQDTELRTRSFSDSGYISKVSTSQSTSDPVRNTPKMPLTPQPNYFIAPPRPTYIPNTHYSQNPQPEASLLPTRPIRKPKPKKRRKKNKVFCTDCPWEGRCESEKRKHIQQKHTKPYGCHIGDCPRSFGSSSDLRRHRLSCHPTDRTPKFKCFASKACAESSKTFSRKDNFTTHLKTHKLSEEQISEQLVFSNKWLFNNVRRELGNVAGHQGTRQQPTSLLEGPAGTHPPQLQDTASLNAGPSFRPGPVGFNPPTTDPVLETTDGFDLTEGLGDSMESLMTGLITDSRDLNAVATNLDPNPDLGLEGSLQNNSISSPNQRPPNLGLRQSEHSDEMERSLRDIETKFQQPSTTKSVVDKERYQCLRPGCNFSCKMPSILRKHVKRHSKPYGCTFNDCYRIFGSKADWKRHESARHTHLERWRCGDPDIADPSLNCARMFERKNSYKAHLKTHGVDDEVEVQHRLYTNKLGGDCQFRFWCGFCKVLIPVTSEAFDASIERFDHIYKEHFEKGEDISSWVLPDGHLTKGEAHRQALEKASVSTDSGTESTVSENGDGNLPLDDSQQSQLAATSSQQGGRRIRTFRASSRGTRSRVSRSPSANRKRRRVHSRHASQCPSTAMQDAATESQPQDQFPVVQDTGATESQPQGQFPVGLASVPEADMFSFSDYINVDHQFDWLWPSLSPADLP
ncbi:hypothetical protein MaudMau93_000048 [Microsporum audouinii]